jgi:hypothetical protein
MVNKVIIGLTLLLLVFYESSAQGSSIVYAIDTSYQHPDDKFIFRYQIFLDGKILKPLLQIDEYSEDFNYTGSINYGDSIIFIFDEYNVATGNSRYYLIAPILKKIYFFDIFEYESASLGSIDIKNLKVNLVSFKNECGEYTTKNILHTDIKEFNIDKSKIEQIFRFQLN